MIANSHYELTPDFRNMWPYSYVNTSAGGTCCPPSDVSGKMVFDLDGGANFTYYASPTAAPVTGSTFSFNADYTKLMINGGADILGVNGCGVNANNKVYEIKEFTADRLVLFVSNASCGSGWIWVFKPAE